MPHPLSYPVACMLVARANLALEQSDTSTWLSYFTADAVLSMVDSKGEERVYRGKRSMATYADHRRERIGGFAHLWMNSPIVEGDATQLSVRSLIVATVIGTHPVNFATGLCEDKLVREDGAWLIAERRLRLDQTGPGREQVR
ncbi:hypothetical protein GCM10011614_32510 [Novosphingobium colocasiae]|uniref:SnoaL-like domain-containing protein n=2 Tax=Novosphingobium colocasiae TaxID=1256513 RepID=A0A918PMQ7_9SPHN|nr:hypothetical protein GCM10011614_32510 [Novosphingobium colocasiae]